MFEIPVTHSTRNGRKHLGKEQDCDRCKSKEHVGKVKLQPMPSTVLPRIKGLERARLSRKRFGVTNKEKPQLARIGKL